jgi:hypothetical protein
MNDSNREQKEMKKLIVTIFMTLFLLTGALDALAALTLVEWNLTAQLGDEAFFAPTYSAANVSGANLTRGAGLTANAGANSMNSFGWNNQTTDYYQFGLTVDPGYMVNISQLSIGTRSSATGPGTMGLYVSTDNFVNTSLLTTFSQAPGAILVSSLVPFSTLNDLTDTIYFRLIQIGTTAANNAATTGPTGTFRVANYSTTISFDLTGSVAPVPAPIPGAVWLLGSGLLGLGGWRKFRKG